MESGSSQNSFKSPNTFSGQLMSCDPQELRPHPSYAGHGLAVFGDNLSVLRERGEVAFLEPVLITREKIIIDGYGLWEIAQEAKRSRLQCIEYNLSEAEALEMLLHRHRRAAGLSNYSRMMLALDLEPIFVEKVRANRQLGSREKAWSNLTKAVPTRVGNLIDSGPKNIPPSRG